MDYLDKQLAIIIKIIPKIVYVRHTHVIKHVSISISIFAYQ